MVHSSIHVSLNACKNILVVSQMMDRPLGKHVLRALNFEWGNPRCCVPVLRALTTDCIFRSLQVPVRQPCHRFYHRQSITYPDNHGFSVRIPHACDHVGRHCGKICPKQKCELSRENMHLACRNEYSRHKCDRRCAVCNGESICGHLCGGDDGLGIGYSGRD